METLNKLSEWAEKNARFLISFLLLVGGVVAIALIQQQSAKEGCAANYNTSDIVTINSQKINVEVALTPKERENGLSGKPCIESNIGMLFTFDKPGLYKFWMKDMKFPIDIIWIGEDHKVVGIESNVQPSTYPDSFVNREKPARYVLELQANRSKELNINLGTVVDF